MAVMVWPYRWIIDPPLDVNVPSKRTPWPDAPPELPTNENVVLGIQEHAVKHPTKTGTSRSKRRSKRKHDTRTVDTQVASKHSEQI
nr:beta-1,4-xylosyltransferase IRX14-like [Ziziphus jujuba var. spinosa]